MRKKHTKPEAPNKGELREVRKELPLSEDVPLPKVQVSQFLSNNPKLEGEEVHDIFTPNRNLFGYPEALKEFHGALSALNLLCENASIVKSWKYSPEREKEQPAYIAKLEKLIIASTQYIKTLHLIEKECSSLFAPDNLKRLSIALNTYIDLYTTSKLPTGSQAIAWLSNYKGFLDRLVNAQGKLESFQDEEVHRLTTEMCITFSSLYIALNQPALLQITGPVILEIPKLILEISKIYELIGIRKRTPSNMHSAIHNLENVLIETRLLLLIKPNLGSINLYLKMNLDLINIQVSLLELFTKKPDSTMTLWPFLNRDLLRAQEKGKPILAIIILKQKKDDRKFFMNLTAAELIPII